MFHGLDPMIVPLYPISPCHSHASFVFYTMRKFRHNERTESSVASFHHDSAAARPMCFRRAWSETEPGTVFERRRLLAMTHRPLLSSPRGPGS